MGFTVIDGLIIVLYLVAVAVFGIWSAGVQRSSTDYFLGGRNMPWWAILFSVIATETSTLTFISIPAVAYGSNLTFLQLTFGYILGRIIVAIWFLPAYVKGEMTTAYQFLEVRFGAGMRKAASSTFIITRLWLMEFASSPPPFRLLSSSVLPVCLMAGVMAPSTSSPSRLFPSLH